MKWEESKSIRVLSSLVSTSSLLQITPRSSVSQADNIFYKVSRYLLSLTPHMLRSNKVQTDKTAKKKNRQCIGSSVAIHH